MSLCAEAKKTFFILKSQHSLDEYYSKYLPIIIREIIDSIHADKILKKKIGLRLESVISGLNESLKNQRALVRWLDQIFLSCSIEEYIEAHKIAIIECIINNKEKTELMRLAKNFWTSIISYGYSIRYVSQILRTFIYTNYSNFSVPSLTSIFDKFDLVKKKIEILSIVDNQIWEYFCNLDIGVEQSIKISELDFEPLKEKLTKHEALSIFYKKYTRLIAQNNNNKIKMVKFTSMNYDHYQSLQSLKSIFEQLNDILSYFKHETSHRHIFDCVYIDLETIRPVKQPKSLGYRPYINQDIIDKRVLSLFTKKKISHSALNSLISSLSLHSDALSLQSESLMLRTFWSAAETLFATNNTTSEKENAIYSILHIERKTYTLKILRGNFFQLQQHIKEKSFWEDELSIRNFSDYVEFFVKTEINGVNFKRLYSKLGTNPLLRSRTFQLKKKLSSPKSIFDLLEAHYNKIYMQLCRIYRARNLSTHAGIELPHNRQLLTNLHNYFDYVLNYMFCKMENGHQITSIQSIVLEAKNDNSIHNEFLKKQSDITLSNYKECLFGPDNNLILYEFEYSSH